MKTFELSSLRKNICILRQLDFYGIPKGKSYQSCVMNMTVWYQTNSHRRERKYVHQLWRQRFF